MPSPLNSNQIGYLLTKIPQWMWPVNPQTGQRENPANIQDPARRDQALNDFVYYVNEQETLRTQAQQAGRPSGNQAWLDELDPDGGIRMATQQHAGIYTPPTPPPGNPPPGDPPPPEQDPYAGMSRGQRYRMNQQGAFAPPPPPPPPTTPPPPAPGTPPSPGTPPPPGTNTDPSNPPVNPAPEDPPPPTNVPPAGAISSRYRRRQNRIKPPGMNVGGGGSIPPINQ